VCSELKWTAIYKAKSLLWFGYIVLYYLGKKDKYLRGFVILFNFPKKYNHLVGQEAIKVFDEPSSQIHSP
jgi:hypothetical protein